MPNIEYIWERNGRDLSRPCECGGTFRGYSVTPERKMYYSHILACDGPDCNESVVHEGTDAERRSRKLILLG